MTPEQRDHKRAVIAAWRQTPAGRASRVRENVKRRKGRPSPMDRINRKIVVEGTCWIWQGAKVGIGHGTISVNNRCVLVHRYLWELKNGPVPAGLECGHRCPGGARASCVNPDHIEAITHSENCLDRFRDAALRAARELRPAPSAGRSITAGDGVGSGWD